MIRFKRYLLVIIALVCSSITLASNPPLPGELAMVTDCLERDMITPVIITMYTADTAVNELGFSLIFDATRLDFVGFQQGDLQPITGWDIMTCSETTPGQLDIYAYSDTGSVAAGLSGDLLTVDLCCIWDSGSPGDETPLGFTNFSYDLADYLGINDVLIMGDG